MHDERPRSRRAVLMTAFGAAAGAVAAAAGLPGRAVAADGEPLVIGQENQGDSATRLTRSSSGPVFMTEASGPGVAASARSGSGIGVYGLSDTGHGVLGSSVSGSGVEAWSRDGWALRVRRGRVKLDQVSGVATIAAGEASVAVRSPEGIAPTSFVLLTPMTNLAGRDLWFDVQLEDGTFSIHLSSAVDESTRVAWLMIG